MFGGLEIKGNSDDTNEQESASASPASSFGFLNTMTSEASAPTSSFSFLNFSAPVPAMDESAPSPVATTSRFSLIMTTDAKSNSTALTNAPEPAPEQTGPDMSVPTVSSGFGFLIPSPSNDEFDATEAGSKSIEPNSAAPISVMSGFSFLATPAASTDGVDSPALPTTETLIPSIAFTRDAIPGSAASSVVSEPSGTSPGILDMSTASLTASKLPTGAGITFGNSAKRNVMKKKKTRATRIGAGAATGGPPPVHPPSELAPVTMTTSASSSETKSSRDEAIEAAKRAEEFMQNKVMEEAKAPPLARKQSPVSTRGSSTDSVVVAAQKAAEEAKALQQQHQKGGGFMGTFFKGFRASPNTIGSMSGSSSNLPAAANDSGSHQQSAKRSIPQSPIKASRTSSTEAQDDDYNDGVVDDDDMVVVTTKNESKQPESIHPPASTFIPLTLPSTEIGGGSLARKTSSAFSHSKSLDVTQFVLPEIKAPPSLPTPTKSKTPAQVFEEYQTLFAQSVHRAMEQLENVRSQQKMLLEERFVSLAKDRLATQQIEQTEQQLQTAVEEEDYELADQLGQVVEGHRREKHEVGLMLENIAKAMYQLDSQKELVVEAVAKCFHNLAVRLEELKEKNESSEQKDDEETLKQFASISKQLSAEQERLQQDLKHLERDEQLVAEERKELEDAIKEQTGEIEIQETAANSKLEKVQAEIDDLRKKLEIKQKEAADLRTDMFGFEDAISKVRVKFSRQLTRVDKKERALKESRSEWELEDASHKRQKAAHDLQVQSHSEALLAHDVLMKTLKTELRLSKDFCELIPHQLGFLDYETKEKGESDSKEGELAQLQADVVKCEAAVSEANVILKAATSVVSSLKKEKENLEARIPQLESLKKEAAAKRDFKSASRASKQIKDAMARFKECKEELRGEAESKKKAAEEELARLERELVLTRELANEKEKVSAIEKMSLLAQKITQLVEKKKDLCGEISSDERSVRGVGSFVLDRQIKALKTDGEDLGSKYGGWKELVKEIKLDEIYETSPIYRTGSVPVSTPSEKCVKDDRNEPAGPDGVLTIEEKIKKVKSLVDRLKKAEEDLEVAAANEEFDRAAELQDAIESFATEIADLDLPEDVLANAVSGEGDSDVDPNADSSLAIEASEHRKDEEEKKDTVDEDGDVTNEIEEKELTKNDSDGDDDIVDIDGEGYNAGNEDTATDENEVVDEDNDGDTKRDETELDYDRALPNGDSALEDVEDTVLETVPKEHSPERVNESL